MDDDRPESVFSTAGRQTKLVVSFAVYYCNFVMGICATFLSPLVLDLSSKFDSTVDQVSKVFTIILVCYLCSALLCTLIYKCIKRQIVILFLLSLMTTAFFTIPFATNLTTFFLFSSLIGLGSGGYDTAQVAWIIDIWRHESPPWILAQHFSYSLGTLAPPLLIAHFLPNTNSSQQENDTSTIIPSIDTNLNIPFYVAGAFSIVSIIVNIVLYFVLRNRHPSIIDTLDNDIVEEPIAGSLDNDVVEEPIAGSSTDYQENVSISIPLDSTKRKACLIALACCVIGFYTALELCTQQFLPTFTHFSELKLSPSEGARVLFGLQLGYSIGRLLGILLVLKIPAHFIIAGNFIILTISNTILFMWGGSSLTWLWVGSIMIGVGMSTVYPSLYAFIEKYIFVTESVAGIITVAGGCVSSIYPLIVGNSVESNPEILTYVNFASIVVCSVAFSILFWMTHMDSSGRYKKMR